MSNVIWIHSKEDFQAALDSGGRVVVDFTAPSWCRPCQVFAPHYERAAENTPEITFLAVDVDSNEWTLLEHGVRSVPTVKLFEDGAYLRDVKAPQGALPFIKDIQE